MRRESKDLLACSGCLLLMFFISAIISLGLSLLVCLIGTVISLHVFAVLQISSVTKCVGFRPTPDSRGAATD